MDIIESHGSDTLRIWCLEHAAWGRDFKYDGSQLLKSSGLLTKMLNATRLILTSPLAQAADSDDFKGPLSKELNTLLKSTESEIFPLIQDFQLDQAYQTIRRICWSDWCEGWLNSHKQDIQDDPSAFNMAKATQLQLLALLHPFAPATTWWLSEALKSA
jgi:valyl-tRNA synthetase